MKLSLNSPNAKYSRGDNIFMVFNYAFLVLISIICFYPMYYVLAASLSSNHLLMQHSGLLLAPRGFSYAAYERVINNPMILIGYKNTMFILIVGVALSILMSSIGAYFLSRKNVLFKKPIMMGIVFTMFFSGGMIPTFLNLRDLGLLNSHWGLILPGMISTYNMIIMRTSFMSIPESLTEAAYIDGAGHVQILFRIILPLSKAILAVMVLFYGIGIWNSWFWASVILRNRELFPLQVILREILLQHSVLDMTVGAGVGDQQAISETIKYATIIVATVPVLCIYPFLQKHFARGVLIGGVKE
ncbi:MAG: carbohydrate ABC transporter permease [Treponema sp.]|jgi:putative aldouronate transport system permease protein|nr:carbohydrate ABC transporter permease [Treponema sp.]